ncbi:hypothetical protein MACH01_12490 [Thalassospira tepidiphila]|nr:hypothetical protein MACH01_12490 [Thalassospira tepidiphila]
MLPIKAARYLTLRPFYMFSGAFLYCATLIFTFVHLDWLGGSQPMPVNVISFTLIFGCKRAHWGGWPWGQSQKA